VLRRIRCNTDAPNQDPSVRLHLKHRAGGAS